MNETMPCNARGPNGYHCTEGCTFTRITKIPHEGSHVARAMVGDALGNVVVSWDFISIPRWNPSYRGR